ncbi:MAG: PilZ domain-containing protein [Gammaproteobacteria bacterium]|nr:PilZ domain-containing protein [Gammaproteobacteria bacterium]
MNPSAPKQVASSESNRRTFFRIEDTLQISYKLIPRAELSERIEGLYRNDLDHLSVAAEIMAMRYEVLPLMRQISAHAADIASYLSSIDQRLELVARSISAKDDGLTEQSPRSCNLSASGVAIPVDQPLALGEHLEMNLLLMPSYAGVRAIAEVVSCNRADKPSDGAYLLRVNFSHMREKDRDLLIKHIIQRQGDMLRKRKEEQEGV